MTIHEEALRILLKRIQLEQQHVATYNIGDGVLWEALLLLEEEVSTILEFPDEYVKSEGTVANLLRDERPLSEY